MNIEKVIRTPNNMVFCTVRTDSSGNKILHRKNGKREDDISLNQLLEQIYSKDEKEECFCFSADA